MRIVAGFETRHITLDLWRAVEAQHRASTMVLVDTLDEQALLERLLDEAKPPVDGGMLNLHWLLFTPFRYPPLPSGSRFRAPTDPGVFYGAEERRTACAELGYWRWRFLHDSPHLETLGPLQQTVFRTAVAGCAIDLREPPWKAREEEWTDPVSYEACQAMAREARAAGVEVLRYQSVRDPQHGTCAAVLSYRAFMQREPSEHQTWTLAVSSRRVLWRRDSIFMEETFEFDTARWTC